MVRSEPERKAFAYSVVQSAIDNKSSIHNNVIA